MSAIGAGGCALLAYSNVAIPRLFAIFRLRMGRVCLAYWPFVPHGKGVDMDRVKALSAPWPHHCEACDPDKTRDTVGDVFHLVSECKHEHMIHVRKQLMNE